MSLQLSHGADADHRPRGKKGREIYLRCPNGVGRTRLTNEYFDTKLATTSTMRNWRTVMKLLEMTGE